MSRRRPSSPATAAISPASCTAVPKHRVADGFAPERERPGRAPLPRGQAPRDRVDFGDRLATAAAAKQALLEKAKAKAKANDPELLKKQAERAAIAAAREARENERREAKRAEEARIAAEREAARIAAEEAAAAAAAEAAAAAAAEEAERVARRKAKPVLTEAEQKAARDARYAARKPRKGKR